MTAIVIDASALVAVVADSGPEGRWAESVLGAAETILAPHLVLAEAANILRRASLGGKLTASQAEAAHDALLLLDLELFPYGPFAERIWELRATLTAYDAWYVAVAEAAQLPLATLDRRLAREPGPRCAFRLPD